MLPPFPCFFQNFFTSSWPSFVTTMVRLAVLCHTKTPSSCAWFLSTSKSACDRNWLYSTPSLNTKRSRSNSHNLIWSAMVGGRAGGSLKHSEWACCLRKEIIWSAVMPLFSACRILSRVMIPTTKLGNLWTKMLKCHKWDEWRCRSRK